jgi:hypothetical protein
MISTGKSNGAKKNLRVSELLFASLLTYLIPFFFKTLVLKKRFEGDAK